MDFETRLQTLGMLVGDDTRLELFNDEYLKALAALHAMRTPGCDLQQWFVLWFRLKNLLIAQTIWSRMALERLGAN